MEERLTQSATKFVISCTTMSMMTLDATMVCPTTGWKWPKRSRPPVMKTEGAKAKVSA